jgi:hypothetical protein
LPYGCLSNYVPGTIEGDRMAKTAVVDYSSTAGHPQRRRPAEYTAKCAG